MARGIPVLIGFQANQVGLGGIGRRLAEIIEGIREKITEGIDWLVAKALRIGRPIIDGVLRVIEFGEGLVERGREAVSGVLDRLLPWRRVEQNITTDTGESHRIYVEEINGRPQLMMASVPRTILEFLTYWEANGNNITPAKIQQINDARNHYNSNISPILDQIKTSEDNEEPDSAREEPFRRLLTQNASMAEKVRLILLGAVDFDQIKERYLLEGMTGRYNSIPTPSGDDFEADHQPRAAALAHASQLEMFSRDSGSVGNLTRRGANNAALGFAINLHVDRHVAGRTHGRQAGSAGLLNTFRSDSNAIENSSDVPAVKRTKVVDLLKQELSADVAWMQGIYNKNNTDPIWEDIHDLGLSNEDETELINTIRSRVLAGENQMANQVMDNLKD
jgi:hypothetical protein